MHSWPTHFCPKPNLPSTHVPPSKPKVKIADFGLAKRSAAGAAGQMSTVCGTPQYVAPEVIQGTPGLMYGPQVLMRVRVRVVRLRRRVLNLHCPWSAMLMRLAALALDVRAETTTSQHSQPCALTQPYHCCGFSHS